MYDNVLTYINCEAFRLIHITKKQQKQTLRIVFIFEKFKDISTSVHLIISLYKVGCRP